MLKQWLPGKRYLFRELLPRAIVLTVTFKFILPLVPFHLFEFHGGMGLATVLGLLYTAMFSAFGAYLMGAEVVQKFMEEHQRDWWFIPANLLLVFSVPAAALFLTALVLPGNFILTGAWSVVAGSVILNVACALTHDYRAAV
jgi:hypothetical protein